MPNALKSFPVDFISKEFMTRVSEPGIYVDQKLKGFRVRVTQVETKRGADGRERREVKASFIVKANRKGFRETVTVTIGPYGVFTPQTAREKAEMILRDLRQGFNPNELEREKVESSKKRKEAAEVERRIQKLTLRHAFDEYISAGGSGKSGKRLGERTIKSYRYDFFKCLADWLEKPLVSITEVMIDERHALVSEKHPGQADHVMRILRAVINQANRKHKGPSGAPLIASNPVRVKPNKLKPRKDYVSDDQLESWFQAVSEVDSAVARDYLLFLLLTGVRKAEGARLEWRHVHFKPKTIFIEETKNGESYTLPMTEALRELLLSRKEQAAMEGGSIFVFPSRSASGHIADIRFQIDKVVVRCRELLAEKAKQLQKNERDAELDKAKNFKFAHHSLRRTFTTVAMRLLPTGIVNKLTNHIDGSDVVETHYTEISVENLREPMCIVNEHILKSGKVSISKILGTPPLKTTKVVSIQERRKVSG